jgi:hypothetical protein
MVKKGKNFYKHSAAIENMKGLLVTCEGRKEKQVVRDCNDILNSVLSM